MPPMISFRITSFVLIIIAALVVLPLHHAFAEGHASFDGGAAEVSATFSADTPEECDAGSYGAGLDCPACAVCVSAPSLPTTEYTLQLKVAPFTVFFPDKSYVPNQEPRPPKTFLRIF